MDVTPSGQQPKFEENKRTARILELILMIAAKPKRYFRSELAERFDISERMIQKDLEIVRHGLKLALSRSADGYYFDDVPQLPALQFPFSEALALLLAVQAAAQMSGIGSQDLAAAAARLETLFPDDFTPLLRQQFSQQFSTNRQEHRKRMLALFNLARAQRRKVRMTYETRSRGGASTERVVRPYDVIPYVRSWQLIAHCEWRQSELMFKIDRIQAAILLDETCEIPEDFNLAKYMGRAWGILRGEAGEPVDVVLLFEQQTGHRVAEEDWGVPIEIEEQDDGRLLARLHVAITPEFVCWLLYYGSQVEVVGPAGLRQRVADEHRKAAEANSGK